MKFPPIFIFFETAKLPEKIGSASTHKKPAGDELTGAPFHRNTLSPPHLLPPPSSNNLIPLTRESVFFLTLRHNARGGRCRSVGKIGVIFAPVVFVSDKNAYGLYGSCPPFLSPPQTKPLPPRPPPQQAIVTASHHRSDGDNRGLLSHASAL